jgi:Family of unknown function (DUF6328)
VSFPLNFEEPVYLVCLLCAAVSTGLFIAPAAQHRILFRAHEKEGLLRRANLYAVIASAVLAVAVSSAVLLIIDYLFSRGQAWTAAAAFALLLLWLWIVEPALHCRQSPRSVENDE